MVSMAKKMDSETMLDDSMYDDPYNDIEPDNSRWELETSDVLDKYEHSLKAERKDEVTGKWYRPKGAVPKMNETGIYDTLSDLQTIMHKGVYLGNISIEYLTEETKAETKAYMKKLRNNRKKWNVDKSHFQQLVLSYGRLVFMSLSRPVNDKERMHRNKRYNFNENYKHDEVKPSEIRL